MTLFTGIIPTLFGCRFETVRSGSMSPAIGTGSLVITRSINPYSIEIGDVITYHPPATPDSLVVHRVVGIDNGSPLSFRTKGDANESFDAYLVPADVVVGQVVLNVPWIGYLFGFTQGLFGFVIFLAIPGIIVLYLEFSKLWTHINPESKHKLWRGRNPYTYNWHVGYTALHRGINK